jgi:superfamily II DNA/RNA helicase
MSGKYRRYDMIGAINFWCSENDLSYFSYIEKKTKSQLEEIVTQYDINVDEMLFKLAKQREKMDNFIPEMQSRIKENRDFLLDKIQMLESLLNDEQKEKYMEFCHSQKKPNQTNQL